MIFAISLHQIHTSLLLTIKFLMVKFQVDLPFQHLSATLDPHYFFLPHLSKFSIFGYPSSLFLSIFSGCVCSEYQSCDSSLLGIPGCPLHRLAGERAAVCCVLIASAYCPSGTSSKSSSWSCWSNSPLWTLSRRQVPCKCSEEKRQAVCSLLSLVATAAVSEGGYICLYFSLCIQTNTLLTHL